MGLFDKKFCDICGDKIGLLGNRKLEDGNLCKDCASKLSPWFSERRRSTVQDIKNQLAYREENQAKVAAFNTTRAIGQYYMVLIDEDAKKFCVAQARDVRSGNPDILDFTQVTGCDLDIDESKSEITHKDSEGKSVSYNPPRYKYGYDFEMIIRVNHPYFDEISFRLNDSRVQVTGEGGVPAMHKPHPGMHPEYQAYQQMGQEIRDILTQARQNARAAAQAAAAPRTAVTCPCCGATTIPDASGCCEYCGGAVGG